MPFRRSPKSLRQIEREKRRIAKEEALQKELSRKSKIEAEKRKIREEPPVGSLLFEICGDDIDFYYCLSNTMFVNPGRFAKESYTHHGKMGWKYKKEGDIVRTKKHFHIAGAIALYHGNRKNIQTYFRMCSNLVEPDSVLFEIYGFYLKEENLIRAMRTAKEFYDKSLKD